MTQSLHSTLRDTVEQMSAIAPPELFAVFAAEQGRLVADDDDSGRIAVGDRLPSATLTDAHGSEVVVPAVPSVIVFYRGAWCPYCNVALASYQREVLPVAQQAGFAVVAISPQGPDGSLTIAETNSLEFAVLTDAGSEYARSLGLVFELTDSVKQAQLAIGNDFQTINAGGEWTLPKPTVLVVDSAGIVRFVDVRPDYTERTEPAAILEAIASLT